MFSEDSINKKQVLFQGEANSLLSIGDNTNDPYLSPTPDHFPLVAFSPVPRDFQILLDCDDTELCVNPPGYDGSPEYDTLLEEITSSLKESGFNTIVMMGSYKGCEGMMEAALDTIGTDGKDCDIASIFVTLPRYRESFAAMEDLISHFSNKKSLKGKSYPRAFLVMGEPRFNDWSQSVFGLQYQGTKDDVDRFEWNMFTVPYIYFKQWRDRWLFFSNLGSSGDHYNPDTGEWEVYPLENTDNTGEPPYRSQFSGNAKNQEQYLEAMQLLFHPGLWCCDFFPFVIDKENCTAAGLSFDSSSSLTDMTNTTNHRFLSKRTRQYYHILECFLKKSKETQRPFWAFLCTSATGPWNASLQQFDYFHPIPTIGMLRYSAFNALALGAQGLVCWQYGMGLSRQFLDRNMDCDVVFDSPLKAAVPSSPVPGLSSVSLIYRDNQLWKNVRTVINEVRSLEKIFLGTTVRYHAHYFPGEIPQEYEGLTNLFSLIQNPGLSLGPIASISFSNPQSEGMLLSMIETRNPEPTQNPVEPANSEEPGSIDLPPVTNYVLNKYIVIVNHDAFNFQGTITINFRDNYATLTVFDNFEHSAVTPPVNPPVPEVTPENIFPVESDTHSSKTKDKSSIDVRLLPGSMHIIKYWRI